MEGALQGTSAHFRLDPRLPASRLQVKLARDIIERNQKGLALQRIPSALPMAAESLASDSERLKAELQWALALRDEAQQQQGDDESDDDARSDDAST